MFSTVWVPVDIDIDTSIFSKNCEVIREMSSPMLILLVGQALGAGPKPRLEPTLRQTLVFAVGGAVNGGLVGCLGPCLPSA